MRRFFIAIALFLAFIVCSAPEHSVMAAGSITVVSNDELAPAGAPNLTAISREVILKFTGDASNGTVPATSSDKLLVNNGRFTIPLTNYIKGLFLYSCKVIPGTTAPTSGFNITITDPYSIALDQGLLGSLSNSTNTWKLMSSTNGYPLIGLPITFGWNSTVAGATATLIIDFER